MQFLPPKQYLLDKLQWDWRMYQLKKHRGCPFQVPQIYWIKVQKIHQKVAVVCGKMVQNDSSLINIVQEVEYRLLEDGNF